MRKAVQKDTAKWESAEWLTVQVRIMYLNVGATCQKT